MTALASRAQGCLLGQLAGDALGSLVEHQTPQAIRRQYPQGLRRLADGGVWNTLAGQPSEVSEMALLLARLLASQQSYNVFHALQTYRYWLASKPFACGLYLSSALQGRLDPESQSNGALMRISPLGIFAVNHPPDLAMTWAQIDAQLTHPHPLCQQSNILFVLAIREAILHAPTPENLYRYVLDLAQTMQVEQPLLNAMHMAADEPPEDYVSHQSWVLIALQNCLWQLLHAADLESAVVDTVMRGGDADVNAAVCGALLGALYGKEAIPLQWQERLLNCRPKAGDAHVRRPRPSCFWPVDALEIAASLLV